MRGLTALVRRDYLGAASAFADAEQRGLRGETIRPLRVYALCLAGQVEAARRLAPSVAAAGGRRTAFLGVARASVRCRSFRQLIGDRRRTHRRREARRF